MTPRDKVYGLLGLVTENEQVTTDYGCCLQEVYLEVIRALHNRCDRASHDDSGFTAALEILAGNMLGTTCDSLEGEMLRTFLKDVFDHKKLPYKISRGELWDKRPLSVGYSEEKLQCSAHRWWWGECEGERQTYHVPAMVPRLGLRDLEWRPPGPMQCCSHG